MRDVEGLPVRGGHVTTYHLGRGSVLLFGGSNVDDSILETAPWELCCVGVSQDPPVAPAAEVHSSCGESCYATKNRFLSFVPPPVPAGVAGIAVRVTLQQMPGPDDCTGMPDYSAFDGTEMWVGDEIRSDTGVSTGLFRLQDTPLYRDWTAHVGGVVQVSDCNIVPCSTYRIEAVNVRSCDSTDPLVFSPPLVLETTAVWGDIVGDGGDAPADGDRNVLDVAATVDCLKETPSAPPTTWCDVFIHTPSTGDNVGMSVLDVATVVDALKEYDYPFPGPTAPAPCDGPG